MKRLNSALLELARVRVRTLLETTRSSFFFVPVLYVIVAILAAELMLAVDRSIPSSDLPDFFRTTVASARAMLSTIATAIVTVTGLVVSVSVVALQLASSQYSPRVLRTLTRSPLQQSIIGLTVGTFAYCLIVLHRVRGPLSNTGEAVIPGISTAGALLLAIVAALAILAYVDATARSMEVSQIVRRATQETMGVIDRLPARGEAEDTEEQDASANAEPSGPKLEIRANRGGWVQQARSEALLTALPPDSTLRLEVDVGEYVPRHGVLFTLWPRPDRVQHTERLLRAAIEIGSVRTVNEDFAFGMQQLADIALRGLSPAINAPTTAHEAIIHLADILAALLEHDLPPRVVRADEGRRLIRQHMHTKADLIGLAYDQVRVTGVGQPQVAIDLLHALGMVLDRAQSVGDEAAEASLREQARLVVAGCAAAALRPADLARVLVAARDAGFDHEHIPG